MPVDNELYNQPGDIWWGETGALSLLRTALNPARFGYFRQTLAEWLKIDPSGCANDQRERELPNPERPSTCRRRRGLSVLDVGCGGGLLAEEFARLGCQVTGIDPSAPSIETARAHASQAGLAIAYQVGVGEQLPFADASFDLVTCCDVLEHVSDLELVIAETARVLKPGGVYCFDTINRTLFSKLVTIKLFQEWRATAFLPRHLHAWEAYVTPAELTRLLARHGLASQEITGLTPEANPLRLLRLLLRYKRGRLSFQQLSAAARFKAGGHTLASYLGYALKNG